MSAKSLTQKRERLLARCVEEGDCLIWTGAKDNGRPVVDVSEPGGRRRRVAVRLWLAVLAGDARALEDAAARGRGSQRAFYVARCGVPDCVKPEHTVRKPVALHMAQAGRALAANGAVRAVTAQKIARVCRERRGVLSPEQVAQLPTMVAQLGTQEAAAKALGVSQQAVSVLVRRQQRQEVRPGGVWGGLV